MTAQTVEPAQRPSRRNAARRRAPLDVILLILILAAFYVWALFAARPEAPRQPAPPPAYEAPAPILALPPPPTLETVPAPAQRARRAPRGVTPDAPEAAPAPHDPFAGLEPLTAQELDGISQAR